MTIEQLDKYSTFYGFLICCVNLTKRMQLADAEVTANLACCLKGFIEHI